MSELKQIFLLTRLNFSANGQIQDFNCWVEGKKLAIKLICERVIHLLKLKWLSYLLFGILGNPSFKTNLRLSIVALVMDESVPK